MRWAIDILALLVAIAMLVGLVWFHKEDDNREALTRHAQSARSRLELEVRYRSASRTAELNTRGWPVTIDPNWFEKNPPRNPLVSAECPWVEVASIDQAGLQDPPIRIVIDGTVAGFWYNPYLGLLRARVPVMVSDQDAVDMYNRINATRLSSIFQSDGLLEDTVTTAIANQQKEKEAAESAMDPTKPREPQKAAIKKKSNTMFTQAPK
jgi:hypothetical protein